MRLIGLQDGDNQWLIFTLAEPFKISHIELALLAGQHYSSYFDILASKDKLTWDSVLKSSLMQFLLEQDKNLISLSWFASNEYSYVKYVGHGNSVNDLNRVSEIKILWVISIRFRHRKRKNPTVPKPGY